MSKASILHVRGDVEGIVFPPVVDDTSAMLLAWLATLDRTQWLSPEEIAAGQQRQLKELVAHAAAYQPHFAGRLKQADLGMPDLADTEGFRRLPVLTRRDFQTAGEAIYATRVPPQHEPIGLNETSGSTGEPVTVRRTAVSHITWLAMVLREHLWHRRDFSKPLMAIRGASVKEKAGMSDWGPPVSLLFNSGPSRGLPMRMDIATQLAELETFRPGTFVTFPNNLGRLAERVRETGRRIPDLEEILTVGETLTEETRQAAEAAFGVKVTDSYSSEEFGIIASQCPAHDTYHVNAEALIVEILDETGQPVQPGQSGRVVITDLQNFATPLIRYEIGDHAERGEPCPCGRGLPTIRRILGKLRNFAILPNGTRFWPQIRFPGLRKIAPIQRYQLIQQTFDLIEVQLVVERSLTAGEESALTDYIIGVLKHPFRLGFVYHDGDLPRTANGKFEQFICRVEAKG